jgi:hypothetical protein
MVIGVKVLIGHGREYVEGMVITFLLLDHII